MHSELWGTRIEMQPNLSHIQRARLCVTDLVASRLEQRKQFTYLVVLRYCIINTCYALLPVLSPFQVGDNVLTHLCVLGPLKFQLMIMTVTRILTVFMMNVKSRYLAMSGNTRDVGGRIFDTSSRNTTSDSKMLIPNVTCNQCSELTTNQ